MAELVQRLRIKNEYEYSFGDPGVSRRVTLAFASGSVGTATFVMTPQLLLMFYMTETLAVPPGYAGVALLVPKLWELLLDPLVGFASDRAVSRGRTRQAYLWTGALLFPIGFVGIFSFPDLATWPARLTAVTGMFLLCTTAYSLFAVPYVALPGELSRDPWQRTRLVAWRMAFVSVGILVSGGLAPALIAPLGGGARGYAGMAIIVATLSGLGMVAAAWSARFGQAPAGAKALSATEQLRAISTNRPFRALAGCYFVQMVSNGLNSAMLAYAARYLLGAGEALVGGFLLAFTLMALVATAGWARLARVISKRDALMLASIVYAIGFCLLAPAAAEQEWLFWTAAGVTGIGSAGVQVFAFALLPDVIDANPAGGSGMLTGIWISSEKIGLALGGALGGLLLGLTGFTEGGASAGTQPKAALTAIGLLLSIVPAALMLVSLTGLRRLVISHEGGRA